MNVNDFPKDAFLPARGFRQKLAELFNARAYRPADVRSIRTSVYYSDFETVDCSLRYVVTTGQALRREDGQFIVYASQSRITEDPIRKSLSIDAGYQNHSYNAVICGDEDVMEKLKELDRALRSHADYALAFPRGGVLNLRNDLHLNAASLIFHNRSCDRHDIIYQQKSARYYGDRQALNR